MTTVLFTKELKLAILKRMRTKVRKGWIQGALYGTTHSGKPGVCLLGAMKQSIQELAPKHSQLPNNFCARELSIQSAARDRGHVRVSIFNDHPDTKKADVLRLLNEKIGELT